MTLISFPVVAAVYNGCPKNFAEGVWWDSIKFNSMTVQDCPRGAQGQGSRRCLPVLGGEDADMFDCVSDSFALLREPVSAHLFLDSTEII